MSWTSPGWLNPDVWPFEIRTHNSDGLPLHYLDEGAGPAIVFINAGLWSFIWRDLISELRSDFRCLSLDFPGAGLSGGDSKDVDLAAFVPRVTRWLDALGINDATLGVGRHYTPADKAASFAPYRASRERSRNFHRAMGSASGGQKLFGSSDRALRTSLADLPVLTSFGENNDQFGFVGSWKERFPTAEQHWIEGGNHFPMQLLQRDPLATELDQGSAGPALRRLCRRR